MWSIMERNTLLFIHLANIILIKSPIMKVIKIPFSESDLADSSPVLYRRAVFESAFYVKELSNSFRTDNIDFFQFSLFCFCFYLQIKLLRAFIIFCFYQELQSKLLCFFIVFFSFFFSFLAKTNKYKTQMFHPEADGCYQLAVCQLHWCFADASLSPYCTWV